MIRSGDVLFILKSNATAKSISKYEKVPSTLTCKDEGDNKRENTVSKKYSHVAVSVLGGLFMESVNSSGVILTPIDKLLDEDNGILDYVVYRHENLDIAEDDVFYTKTKTYVEKLYNNDFRLNSEDIEDKGSYYCSQLVSRILMEEDLLSLPSSNLGPSTLFAYMTVCGQETWKDVTDEYKICVTEDSELNESEKIIKMLTLSIANRMQYELFKNKRLKNQLDYLDAAVKGVEDIDKQKPPKKRISKSDTGKGFVADTFVQMMSMFPSGKSIYQNHIRNILHGYEIDAKHYDEAKEVETLMTTATSLIPELKQASELGREAVDNALHVHNSINV